MITSKNKIIRKSSSRFNIDGKNKNEIQNNQQEIIFDNNNLIKSSENLEKPNSEIINKKREDEDEIGH